jgi:hypothetical protein
MGICFYHYVYMVLPFLSVMMKQIIQMQSTVFWVGAQRFGAVLPFSESKNRDEAGGKLSLA